MRCGLGFTQRLERKAEVIKIATRECEALYALEPGMERAGTQPPLN